MTWFEIKTRISLAIGSVLCRLDDHYIYSGVHETVTAGKFSGYRWCGRCGHKLPLTQSVSTSFPAIGLSPKRRGLRR